MKTTTASLKRFVAIRAKSGLNSNLQFQIDAKEAGVDLDELGDATKTETGYVWVTAIGKLIEEYGRLRFEAYPVFKPTFEQINIIKATASDESSPYVSVAGLLLEPGIRYNTTDPDIDTHMNIATVTRAIDGEWNDTDLFDYGQWSDFRKGIVLTEDGRGIFDFYIRRRFDEDGDLLGNITVYIENGEMQRIIGYAQPTIPLWTAEIGFSTSKVCA